MSSRHKDWKFGWFCSRQDMPHDVCALHPHWWNIRRLNLYIKWRSWEHEF